MNRLKTLLTMLAFSATALLSLNAASDPTIYSSGRVANIVLTSDEYSSWINNDDFRNSTMPATLTSKIYNKFKDNFDFIVLILNEDTLSNKFGYAGVNRVVSNAVTGIGEKIFSNASSFGSAGKLKGILHLPFKDGIVKGPFLHEISHCWANYGIPTTVSDHWGVCGGSTLGQLGGFKQSSLKTDIDDNAKKYQVDYFGENANGGNGIPYNKFELYLMGLLPLTDVPTFDCFPDAKNLSYSYDANFNAITTFTADTRVTYDNAKITSVLGTRNPSYASSQKSFKALFVVLSKSALTDKEWADYDSKVANFCKTGDNGSSDYNFWEATDGKGTFDGSNLFSSLKDINSLTVSISDTVSKGGATTIKWSGTSNKVNIDLYKGNTKTASIATNVSSGSYAWSKVPYTLEEGTYFVKVSDATNANTYGYANCYAKNLYITINGKVMDKNNAALAGATVYYGDMPAINTKEESGTLGYGVTKDYWTMDYIVPTKDKISQIDVQLQRIGNPGDLTVSLVDGTTQDILYNAVVAQNSISTSKAWTSVKLKNAFNVTVGKKYGILLSPANYSDENYYVWYSTANYSYNQRTWSGDAFTTSDANGIYSISLGKGFSGDLKANYSSKQFNILSYSNQESTLANQNFKEGTTGVEEPTTTSVKIYPNPTANILYLKLAANDKTANISIYDMQGHLSKTIKTTTDNNGDCNINLNELRQGIYLINIEIDKQIFSEIVTKK
jgi:hypothetical protein